MTKWFTKQLEDKNTHEKVDPFCDNKRMRANNALIKKYENVFLEQETNFLANIQHKSSNFHGLLKMHISNITFKAIEEPGSG